MTLDLWEALGAVPETKVLRQLGSKSLHQPGTDMTQGRCSLGTSAPLWVPKLLLKQTWVCWPMTSKANILTLGCGEGKYICFKVPNKGPNKEHRQLMLKGLNKKPIDFREGFSKAR